jgi:hypothetical protein
MRMIFAHGPWFTEWHHIPEMIFALPVVGVWLVWLRGKIRRK